MTEDYLGVCFHMGPEDLAPGKEAMVTLELMYYPYEGYDKLTSGTTFTVREGPQVVGYGTVLEWIPQTALKVASRHFIASADAVSNRNSEARCQARTVRHHFETLRSF